MSYRAGSRVVNITYCNWRGVTKERRILPHDFIWGRSMWHPFDQWIVVATDLESGVQKQFAMAGISKWGEADDKSLPWRS
jgi:hypothetical protein